jgi:hypothetical protein
MTRMESAMMEARNIEIFFNRRTGTFEIGHATDDGFIPIYAGYPDRKSAERDLADFERLRRDDGFGVI